MTAVLAYPNDHSAELLRDYIETDLKQQWEPPASPPAALSRLVPEDAQGFRAGAPQPATAEDLELVDRLVLFGRLLQSA